MIIQIIYTLLMVLAALNLCAELKRDLMMMQQNSYRTERYMRWLRTSGDTTSVPRLVGLCVFFASMVVFGGQSWGMALMGAFAGGSCVMLMRARYKKPLVWTPRARRIYSVAAVLAVVVTAVVLVLGGGETALTRLFAATVALTGLYCGSHVLLMAAVWLLQPVERSINAGYRRDAERILASMPDLKIIGITGSYGKTSTKHYLHRILSEQFSVTMTPGSFNTTLGVIRTIREHLRPYDEIFIVEMGAKQIGDIKEICDLVHPQSAIITAVGEQHLESFKTIENVQRTKFELVDSLPADGFAVVNNDFPYAASRPVSNVEAVHYGISSVDGALWRAVDIVYSADGTDFTVVGPGVEMRMHTRLVGECNISNLLAAVVMALHYGMTPEKIRFAVADIRQVEHRLSIKRTPGGVTIIDDAFNSNPTGSAMALDVLGAMKGGRRIVITPGMIELGARQEELNREFGRKIAASADIAIVVGQYNRDAILAGLSDGDMADAGIILADTFAQAQHTLQTMVRQGDTVLYENDLPDTFK